MSDNVFERLNQMGFGQHKGGVSYGGGVLGALLGCNFTDSVGVLSDSPGLTASNIRGLSAIFVSDKPPSGVEKIFAEIAKQIGEISKTVTIKDVFGEADISPPHTPAMAHNEELTLAG